jgi:predicted deacylase
MTHQVNRRIRYTTALILLLAAPCRMALCEHVETGLLMAGTPAQTRYYVKTGDLPGAVVTVVGGVHGDEAAGYLAARKLVGWTITRGTLVVLPDANTQAIARNTRGYLGDLNRAFPGKPHGTMRERLAYEIFQLIRRRHTQLLVNMHESRGFHADDPARLGQTFCFDFEESTPYFQKVAEGVNRFIESHRDKFQTCVRPYPTCLSYRAVRDLGIPATAIETCRSLPILQRIKYQLIATEAFLDEAGIGYRQTDITPRMASAGNLPSTWRGTQADTRHVPPPDAPEVSAIAATAVSSSAVPPMPDVSDVTAVAQWLRRVTAVSPRLALLTIGHSPAGRGILAVTGGRRKGIDASARTVAIVCRQHGDEPAPTLAALKLIADLATTRSSVKCKMLESVQFVIIPIASPEGALSGRRFVRNGKNLNRDWGTFVLPETRAIDKFLKRVRPDVLLDCHELLRGDYETSPYVECDIAGLALANHIRQRTLNTGGALVVGRPARDCPRTLLYRYFESAYHRPAVMLESALVGDGHADRRANLHFLAAWSAADYVGHNTGVAHINYPRATKVAIQLLPVRAKH